MFTPDGPARGKASNGEAPQGRVVSMPSPAHLLHAEGPPRRARSAGARGLCVAPGQGATGAAFGLDWRVGAWLRAPFSQQYTYKTCACAPPASPRQRAVAPLEPALARSRGAYRSGDPPCRACSLLLGRRSHVVRLWPDLAHPRAPPAAAVLAAGHRASTEPRPLPLPFVSARLLLRRAGSTGALLERSRQTQRTLCGCMWADIRRRPRSACW
jgi:hypothetical protein